MNAHAARTSPCIQVCMVDGRSGLCRGCGRSLREITHWSRFTDAEREAILAELPRRLPDAGEAGR